MRNRGVRNKDLYRFPYVVVINITISITYRNHYPTKYSKYQKYLYDRIKSLKMCFVSPKRWFEIRNILNDEGLKTPKGHKFEINNVMSIYKKGKVREERLNSEVKVEKSLQIIEYDSDQITILD